MPAKSEAQRRLLNARFGHAWVKKHHFDNKGKLPARVGGRGRKAVAMYSNGEPGEKAATKPMRVGGMKKSKATLKGPGKPKSLSQGLKSHGKTHDGFKGCKFGC